MADTNSEARARGQALRTARVARARAIRRRIVAGSVALFVAAWLLITLVLVSGHDPALAKKTAASTSSSSATTLASNPTTTSSGGTSTTSSSQDTGSTSSSGSGSTSSSSGNGVSSVTTSQS